MKQIIEVAIPARAEAPATTLGLCLVHADEVSLKEKPYTLILPGGPGANHSHYQAYECLQEVTNLLFYDPRGCGLSETSEQQHYTMDNYIDDLHCIKITLQLDQVALLGKSYGAICALGYTLRYPKDVAKLILVAGSASYRFIQTAQSYIKAKGTAEQNRLCELLWQGQLQDQAQAEEYFKVMAPIYSWKKRQNIPCPVTEAALPFAYEVLNEGFKNQCWHFDHRSQLSTIQCPTLILVGEFDWVTAAQYSKEMAANIPNSSLCIIQEADHAVELDAPEQLFDTLRSFLRQP